MKAYADKPQRIDPARCLQAELRKGKRATKKAARRAGKQQIDEQ